MQHLSEAAFARPQNAAALVRQIARLTDKARPLRIMEVCGTHTMAIAKAGLRGLLAPGVSDFTGLGYADTVPKDKTMKNGKDHSV